MSQVRVFTRPYDWVLDEPAHSYVLDERQRRVAFNRELSDQIVRPYLEAGIPVAMHTGWTLNRPPVDLYVHDINMGAFRVTGAPRD